MSKPQIQINVDGGLVTGVFVTGFEDDSLDVVVHDYDTDGAEDDRVSKDDDGNEHATDYPYVVYRQTQGEK